MFEETRVRPSSVGGAQGGADGTRTTTRVRGRTPYRMSDATAEDFYDKKPIAPPQLTDVVAPHPTPPTDEGHFYIAPEVYNALPHFKWRDIYSTTGAPVEIKQRNK